jgi:hypothetical protein
LWLSRTGDRLTAANPNIDRAWNNPACTGFVDEAQVAVMQSEFHGFGSSGIEMDALESN